MITTKTQKRGERSQESGVRMRLPLSWLLTPGSWLLSWCLGAWVVMLLGFSGSARGQGDVIGLHDMSAGGTSQTLGSCLYCHAPHSGVNGKPGIAPTPLWNQKLSSVPSYQLYTGPGTMVNATNGHLILGTDSTLCLSCHDGTVAVGTTAAYGTIPQPAMTSPDNLGTDLSSMHPINFVLNNGYLTPFSSMQPELANSPPTTHNPAVPLINGNVECTSCHNPHVQKTDPTGNFLVVDNTGGALCTACH